MFWRATYGGRACIHHKRGWCLSFCLGFHALGVLLQMKMGL